MSDLFSRGSRAGLESLRRFISSVPNWMRRAGYYWLALGFVAAAATLRWMAPDVLGPTPFLAFYLAWVGAAAFGGLGPGLFATAASWLCVEVLFDFTPGQAIFGDPMEVGRFLILMAGGLTVSLVAERMRRGRISERRQRQQLADLARLTGLGQLLIRDEQDRIVYWSDGCTRLYGFTAEQAVGRVSTELLRTEFSQPLETIQATLHKTGRWEGELAHRRSDESVVYVASLWVLRNGTDHPVVLEINNDITGRKRAEEALRESEQRYHTVGEAIPYGVWLADAAGCCTYVSDSFLELVGMTLQQVRQLGWLHLLPPQDVEPTKEHWLRCVATGEPFEREHRFRTSKGDWRHVLAIGRPIWDEQGQITSWVGINLDITARKQTEEALRKSENEKRLILDSVNEAIAYHDANQNLIWANRAYLESTNLELARLRGKKCYPCWGIDKLCQGCPVARALQTGDSQSDELTPENQGWPADYKSWLVRAAPVKDSDGNVIGAIEMAHDITERKRSEEALRERESFYRQTLESIPGMVFTTRPDGYCDYQSEQWVDYTGVPMAEHLGSGWNKLLHPEDRPRALATWRDAVEGRSPYDLEYRVRRRDGQYEWFRVIGRPIRDEAGQIVRWFGVAMNIEEIKRAEESLRQALAQAEEGRGVLEAMMEHIPLGITIADAPDTTIRMVSRYGRELVEKTSEELTNIPAEEHPQKWDIYHADGITPATAEELPLTRATQQGEMVEAEEWVVVRRDGTKIPILCTAGPIRDKQGRITGGVIGWQDMTQRKQVEARLQQFNEELEQQVKQRTAALLHRTKQLQKLTLEISETEDRERRRMAEILHDDLQQQLAAAKFHLSLLRGRSKHDASVQATAAQIDNMLTGAIQKSRSLSHELSPAVMHHADFAETLRWLANQIQGKHGLVVHVRAHSEVRAQSEAIKGFLYKTIQELLFNIVKHARVNEAKIQVRQCRQSICLTVSDRGRGFDPQRLRDAAGFGLLNIRERIELLGGRMRIKSAQGQGSTFFIVVPAGEPVGTGSEIEMKPNGRTEETQRAPAEDGARLRVLLADDHEIVREGIRSVLSDEHDVEIVGEAANGREAVDLADRLHPDVVIMDVSMPLIDGDAATRQIKALRPQTRVIALSMYEEPEKKETMHRAGAESYVLKTAPAEELLSAIRGQMAAA